MGQPSISGFFLRVRGRGVSLGSSWPCLFPAGNSSCVQRGTFKEGTCPSLWHSQPEPPGPSQVLLPTKPSVFLLSLPLGAQSLLSRFSISSVSNRIARRWLLVPSRAWSGPRNYPPAPPRGLEKDEDAERRTIGRRGPAVCLRPCC